MEDDVDAGLEQRLRLICQSDRSEKEQSNNKVEEMPHVCRCGSINSRVMRHTELNEMCQGPRPNFRPGPNQAFSPSVGGPEWIGIVGREYECRSSRASTVQYYH